MIIHSPRQLLAAIPHLIGFHPESSLVFVVFDDNEVKTIARIDWPDHQITLPANVVQALRSSSEPSLVFMAYHDNEWTLEQVVDLVDGISETQLLDALWVRKGHWGSLMCDDHDCCPVDGHLLTDISATDVEFIVAGSAPFESRDEMVNRLSSVNLTASDIDARSQARIDVDQEVKERLEFSSTKNCTNSELITKQRDEIVRDVATRLRNFDSTSWTEHAWICVVVADVRMRDALLRTLFDQDLLRPFIRSALMTTISQANESDVPSLATVLAGCAWLDGNGALASVALDRALDVDPSYSLARLLDRAITHGVPPSVWADSLEAVSYEECLAGAA